jgi:hypothetical protein
LEDDMSNEKSPPVITSPYGTTTESARRQCSANMAADPAVKKKVVDALVKMYGDRGEVIARERYPEAFEDSK